MNDTTYIEQPAPIDFEQPATLTGDLTIRGEDSFGRIWLGTGLGSVSSGLYAGTQIIATGTSLALYVQRDGKSVGDVKLDLGPIIAQAIEAFEKAEAERSA